MKKTTFIGLMSASSLLLLAACSDETLHTATGTGTIFPLVEFDPTVVTSSSSSRSGVEIEDLTVEDLTIAISNEDGSVEEEYPYSEFPTDKGFPVGEYTMTVSYGSEDEEGFETPAVSGTCTVTVTEDNASKPVIEATPSKAMVYINFDDMLLGYMKSIDARILGAGGTYIDYVENETRPAYVMPGETSVSVDFIKQNGNAGKLEVATFEAEAQHCYTMTLTLAGDGYGKLNGLTVKYDEMLEQEDVTIDISDEVLSKPAPEVTAVGFTPGETVSMVEGTLSAKLQPRFNVKSISGLTKATLTTHNCPSLLEKGWPVEVDLCNPSAEAQTVLSELGLRTGGFTGVTDKFAAVDLTYVLPNITPRSDDEPASEFTLAVTDIYGKTCDPVTFSVKVELLELEMSCDGTYAGEGTIDLNVHYNGPNLKDNLTLEYLNMRGLWVTTEIISIKNEGEDDYILTVDVPENAKSPLTFRGTVGLYSQELEVSTLSYSLSCNPKDVFATTAILTVTSAATNPADHTIEAYGSTDGGATYTKLTATQKGSEIYVTGLTPAKEYTFRVSVDGTDSRTVKATTEAATQITNGKLDYGWGSVAKGSHNLESAPTPWADLNVVSAGKDSNGTNKYAHPNSTMVTDQSKSGKAAHICTIGYGFSGHTLGLNNPSQFIAGELFLGNHDNGAEYGIDFSSRPSAVKFSYKYSPYKSGENGTADVWVKDAAGNIIASGTLVLGLQSAYKEETIPLTYVRGTAKAATMCIKFRCTNVANEALNSSYVTASKTVGVLTESYHGAELYIDDVELAY